MTQRVSSLYQDRVMAGAIRVDEDQREVVELFDSLADDVVTMATWHARRRNPLLRWWTRHNRSKPCVKQGLYLYGDVGRGKSLLMDLFFEAAPTAHKKRVHFHAFMQDIHARMDALRQQKNRDSEGLLATIARRMVKRSFLICFDEFQVTNIADAMILGRLFEALFAEGAIVVATSNCAPNRLYKDGLQRSRFEPFIELLEHILRVRSLDGRQDYRLRHVQNMNGGYHTPLGKKADAFMNNAFATLTASGALESHTVRANGRVMKVTKAHGDVAWFSFAELCEQPLGAADYLAIAEQYTTVLLSDIPQFTPELRNEAMRFIALIDALYEHHTKLVASAAVAIDALSTGGDHDFAFARTASRLVEMQSEHYWHLAHISESNA